MSFTHTTPIINKSNITSASFESDPPFEYGWAKSGTLSFYCNNWGNVDNNLVIDVYWGTQENGLIPIRANIVWRQDSSLTTTISGSGGTTTKVAGLIDVPTVNGRYMKLVCTLSGTTKEVDVFGWFHGSQSGGSGGGGSVEVPSTVLNGRTTVTTAGTQVALSSSTACKSVTVKALSTNTGVIYVGNSSVSSSDGLQLAAGDSVNLDIDNLGTVYIDSSVNGEGVTFLGVN